MNTSFASPLCELQIELSTVCNALCLGCVRTDQINFIKSKPHIPKNKFIDTDLLFHQITSSKKAKLQKLEFCGNIDEPLAHPNFIQLLEKLSSSLPHLTIAIHTNGSIRNPKYFTELSSVLKKFKSHNIRFSIDGLADTNSIYRQNTSFDKIIENAEAFIRAGGSATWQYIHFPWNGHSIDEAELLAEKMGFKKFLLRKDRSIDPETMDRISKKASFANLQKEQKRSGFNSDVFKKYDNHKIDCFFKKFNMMFISWDGKLWPCCYTSNVFYESNLDKIESFEKNFYGSYDRSFNDLHKHSIDDMLEHPIFQKNIVEGWSESMSPNNSKKIWRCVEKCRSDLEPKAHIKSSTLSAK